MSSGKLLGLQSKRISSGKSTNKNQMGSLIVSSRKDNEKIKPNDEMHLTERRSLRLSKQTQLDPSEKELKLIQSKGEDFEGIEPEQLFDFQENQMKTIKKLKRNTVTIKEENVNKKSKLIENQKSIPIYKNNTTVEEIRKKKNNNKKNRHQIFWENKLTGARRVSKRLSKLELKNKQLKSQLVPEVRKIHSTRHIPTRNESTYEKSTFRTKISSGKTAQKRVKTNKFLVSSKLITAEATVEDEEVVVSLTRVDLQTQQPENICSSYLEQPEIPLDNTCFVTYADVAEDVEEKSQEMKDESEATTGSLLSDIEDQVLTDVETIPVTNEEDEYIIVENEENLDKAIDVTTQSIAVAEVLELDRSINEHPGDPKLDTTETCSENHLPASNIGSKEMTSVENESLGHFKRNTSLTNADESKDEIYQCEEVIVVQSVDVEVDAEKCVENLGSSE